MPASPSFLNQVASGFNKTLGAQSSNKAAANDGAGDSDMASAHAAVNQDLAGSICPDCHQAVKGAMVQVFGQPANEAQGADVSKEDVDKMNMDSAPKPSPLQAIRDPQNQGIYKGE